MRDKPDRVTLGSVPSFACLLQHVDGDPRAWDSHTPTTGASHKESAYKASQSNVNATFMVQPARFFRLRTCR